MVEVPPSPLLEDASADAAPRPLSPREPRRIRVGAMPAAAEPLARGSVAPSGARRKAKGTRREQEASGGDDDGDGAGAEVETDPAGDDPPRKRPRTTSSSCANGSSRASATSTGSRAEGSAPEVLQYRWELSRLLAEKGEAERGVLRERLRSDARRLGQPRRGILGSASERDAAVQWEGGTEAEQLEALRLRISEQKLQVEQIRRSMTKAGGRTRPSPTNAASAPAGSGSTFFPSAADSCGTPAGGVEDAEEEAWEKRELCNSKVQANQREENELREREQKLQVERFEYLRLLNACEAEDQAELTGRCLRRKYQLIRVLSAAQRTEVYRAQDLELLQACVVRIHSLDVVVDAADREERLRLLTAECESVKRLRHSALCALLGFFPQEGGMSFVTVWEFCDGDSLEAYLLRNGPIPEKEARGIFLQILSALKYADSRGHALRSRDVRPPKLVFRCGEVKVPSIGLARLHQSPSPSSPEVPVGSPGCTDTPFLDDSFCSNAQAASSSALGTAAATFHEMLFSRRPERTICALGGEGAVQLPDLPKVSAECREYLLRLLDRDRRLTLQEAYSDPYIRPRKS